MKVLICNDDGINSNGIYSLAQKLRSYCLAEVVAPEVQQSAVGHALTMSLPLRVNKFYKNNEHFGYSVSGTPADCVKIALSTILDYKPDFILSGINHGRNTANSIMYSGTISGATEGTMLGIPSIAISLDSTNPDSNFDVAAQFALKLIKYFQNSQFPENTLLNVNVPNVSQDKIRGIKITEQAESFWNDRYIARQDPTGQDYYWLTGEYKFKGDENSDDYALLNNYISVTPIHTRITNYQAVDFLKNSFDEKLF